MVRWTQLNALMPALQFSIAPWDLSEETAKLCAEAVALRKKVYHSPLGACAEAVSILRRGAPARLVARHAVHVLGRSMSSAASHL